MVDESEPDVMTVSGWYPRPVLSALVSAIAVLVGFALGWRARGGRVVDLERQRARDEARIGSHVVPVLSRRAASLELGRADEKASAVEAAVEVAKRIQKAEEKLVLPFSDTLEMSRNEVASRSKDPPKDRAS
jgi:hypothetical protein